MLVDYLEVVTFWETHSFGILAWVISPVHSTGQVAQIVGSGDSFVYLKLTDYVDDIECSAFLMMATSVIVTLPEFDPKDQDAASYLENVELFF